MMVPHLLFVPGWAADATCWNAVLTELPTAIPYDVTPWEEHIDTNTIVSHVDKPVWLVGWSLGALLSLQAALDTPTCVSGLVLVSGTARMTQTEGYAGADLRTIRAMRVKLKRHTKSVLTDFTQLALAPAKAPELAQRFATRAQRFSTDTLSAGLRFLEETDLRTRASSLDCPVLLVHGEADEVIPLACAKSLQASLKNTTLKSLTGAGHALPLTHGKQIADTIAQFIHEHL